MQDSPQEHVREPFFISSDRARLDLEATLRLLHSTHWGKTMPLHVLERAVANSVCFGIYTDTRQIGFGRVVSDLATYAYLTDFVIEESYRGQGLGGWLVECVLPHPDFQHLRRMALVTMNAQKLYEPFGFTEGSGALLYMEKGTMS
jgi:GNAT superfamily N-acetyltransferase